MRTKQLFIWLVALILVGSFSMDGMSPVVAAEEAPTPETGAFEATVPPGTWTRLGGPIGGLGYDVRYGADSNGDLNTNIMYVTDNYSGVNKSTNGGQTWFTTNTGINKKSGTSGDAYPVFSLTVDPNNGNNVWVGLKDAIGAFKSTDGGANWIDVTPLPSIAPTNFAFRGFTVQPGNSNIVYAAGEIPTGVTGKVFDLVRGRVFRTADGGATWKTIWDGENLARYVIIHPNDPNTLFISTGIFDREANNSDCKAVPPAIRGGEGVIKVTSPDGGVTWNKTAINNGLSDLYVGSLVMHPLDPDILLAGAGNNSCSTNADGSLTGGVFITMNGGLNWEPGLMNGSPIKDVITSVEFSPSEPKYAYAGGRLHFYFSEDGGINWKMVGGSPWSWGPPGILAGFPIDILVDPFQPFTLFANNYGGGNVKSIDGGENWTIASQGYTGALMFDLAVHPTNAATVFSTARSGIFRSTNSGQAWQGLSYPNAMMGETYAVALKSDNPQIALAAEELLGRVFRSTDGGSSWTHVYTIPGVVPGDAKTASGFKRLVFSTAPGSTGLVYAGTCRGTNLIKLTSTCNGVYRSLDSGLTWQQANDANMATQCINDLAIHPQNPGIIFAATVSGGLMRTFDGGGSWAPTSLPVSFVRSVAIRPDNPDVVYAGTESQGIYASTNGGNTWTPLVAGLEPNDDIWSIVFDPANPGVAWAGSDRKGVYRWDPASSKWALINTGLDYRAVTRLGISSDGSILYANTWGGGVYRMGSAPAATAFLYLPIIQR